VEGGQQVGGMGRQAALETPTRLPMASINIAVLFNMGLNSLVLCGILYSPVQEVVRDVVRLRQE
jgi:hypothetical protein